MIPVQAAIGGKIVARESIKGFKKDVLPKFMEVEQLTKKKTFGKAKRGKQDQNNLEKLRSARSLHRCFKNK